MQQTFILGAGFSMPAKFPSGAKLNERFFGNTEGKLLKFSSGEWSCDEHSEIESHNGKLNLDYLNISYLLSELILLFQKETSLPFDYEEFYDWINKDFSSELIAIACEKVNQRLNVIGVHKSHFFSQPGINEYRKIQDCYVYLIADLLRRNYKRDENLHLYSSFVNKIKETNSNDVFTLNHDLLLEYIFEKNCISYSDGFTSRASDIVGFQKKALPIFRNIYNDPTRIYKLHGSVDYYLFFEMEKVNV